MKENNDFEYKYVALDASERKEIESIKNSYLNKEKSISKLDLLRKLDNKVKNYPTTISLVFGIISSLIFGLGLTMVLEWNLLVFGIIIMFIGFILMLCTYPLYKKISKIFKNKYSKEIINLSEELLKDEN